MTNTAADLPSHAELLEIRNGCVALVRRIDKAMDRSIEPVIPDDLMSLAAAARQARKTKETMRRWCTRHKIGTKVAGRWMVSLRALRGMHAS